MKILVVAATEMEIAPFLQRNPEVETLITGVGAPACVYALTKQLHRKKYDMAIQAGIAGTFDTTLLLSETFIVNKDVFADLGMQENGSFFTLIEKGFALENDAPYQNGWLNNEIENQFSLEAVSAVTVNTVTDNLEQIQIIQKKFLPQLESMEGAAFHYVCLQESISFLQIRSISNVVGDRNKANWKIRGAVTNLNENLARIVAQLLQKNK